MINNPSISNGNLNSRMLLMLFGAGVCGTILFEFYNIISTNFFDKSIQPVVLATKLTKLMFGLDISHYPTAMTLHILTGILFYPALYLFILKTFPNGSVVFTGFALGIATWILAQGIFSPMVGRPFFNGFGQFTWLSFFIHNSYGLMVSFSFAYLCRRFLVVGNAAS